MAIKNARNFMYGVRILVVHQCTNTDGKTEWSDTGCTFRNGKTIPNDVSVKGARLRLNHQTFLKNRKWENGGGRS